MGPVVKTTGESSNLSSCLLEGKVRSGEVHPPKGTWYPYKDFETRHPHSRARVALPLSTGVYVTLPPWWPGQAAGHGQALDDPQQPTHPVVSSGKPQIIQFMKPNPVFRLDRVSREITHSLLQLW